MVGQKSVVRKPGAKTGGRATKGRKPMTEGIQRVTPEEFVRATFRFAVGHNPYDELGVHIHDVVNVAVLLNQNPDAKKFFEILMRMSPEQLEVLRARLDFASMIKIGSGSSAANLNDINAILSGLLGTSLGRSHKQARERLQEIFKDEEEKP